jgi:parallel beta-helix repeat protein
MKFIKITLASLSLSLFFIFSSVKADIIYLKTGGELEGKIVEDTPDYLTLKTKTGTINIEKGRIQSVEKKEIKSEEIYRPQELYLVKLREIDQASAHDHYELGLFCLENSLFSEAEKEFKVAQQLDNSYKVKVEEKLREIEEKRANDIYGQALIFYNRNDYKKAIFYFKKVITDYPQTELSKEAFLMIDKIKTKSIRKDLKNKTELTDVEVNLRIPEDFPTLKEAVLAAKEGDVIYISPGEYREEAGLKLKSNLTLLGAGADLVKITIGGSGLKFEDIETRRPVTGVKIENLSLNLTSQPIKLNYNEDIRFKDCIITGSSRIGFYIVGSKGIEITNCTISGFLTGITIGHGPTDLIIRNSIMAGNKKYNLYVQSSNQISISFIDPYTGKEISQETKEKLLSDLKDINLTLLYNDIYGAESNYYNCVAGPFDISVDPEFVAPFDFHLKPTSPCIDAGDPDPKYNDSDGSRADIGALPYLK